MVPSFTTTIGRRVAKIEVASGRLGEFGGGSLVGGCGIFNPTFTKMVNATWFKTKHPQKKMQIGIR